MRFKIDARRFIYQTMQWSRALIPVIALLAAVASSVRTVQTTAEIYAASGTSELATIFVSLAFAISAEGAIFLTALAQEYQLIKWKQSRKKRQVLSLRTLWRAVKVRLGLEEPLSYDQLSESTRLLDLVIFIAFTFAMISNFNMGIRPLIDSMKSSNLQSFISDIVNAPAHIQLAFIVDLASVLFPPIMALVAGHLTARYASEVLNTATRQQAKAERAKSTPKPATEPGEPPSKKRVVNASERIKQHLNEHPEDLDGLSYAQLAKKIGVSVGSVHKIVKPMKEQPFSANGHGEK